jgi:hypothetical protein
MPKFFAIFHVRLAMIVEILARAFNSIMKTPTLRFAKLRRRRIPIMTVILLGDSGGSGSQWPCICLGSGRGHKSQRKNKN